MTWAAWLTSLVPSLVGRVLLALGFSVVTITGVDAVGAQIMGYIATAHAGIGADTLAVMNLAGFGAALNILIGAVTARIALYVMTSAAKIIGTT